MRPIRHPSAGYSVEPAGVLRNVRRWVMFAWHRNQTRLLLFAAVFTSGCVKPPVTADAGESGTDTGGEDTSCIPGELQCECNQGQCLADLECVAGICMEPGGDGDGDGDGDGESGDGDGESGDGDGESGDGDGDTGDGDGDTGDGDGDGDPCGNGNIELGEQCDDGNNVNGDGCNTDCTDSGAMLWQEIFPVFGDDDFAWGVAVDSADRIFVSGHANVIDANNTDGWYRKYSPDGQLYWDETFGGPRPESAFRIAVNPDDDILVVGQLWNLNNNTSDAMLRKLDQNGAEIWTRQFELLEDDYAFGVAVADDGTIVMTGGSASGYNGYVRRYDANGNVLWTKNFGDIGKYGWEAGYTDDGNIAVLISFNRYVRLYSTAGNEVWTWSQNGTCDATSLAIDGNDVLVAGCEVANPTFAWFARLNPNGNLLWDETFTGDGNTVAHANDIEIDSAGRIIAVGTRVVNQHIMAVTRKYSSDGQTLIWEQTLQGGKQFGSNDGVGVVVDSQDNVIVVGQVEQEFDFDAFVAKYGP